MESIIGIVLVFPLGVWVGYRWRDRISQQHRRQYLAERFEREQREALRQAGERRSRRDFPNISEAIIEFVEITIGTSETKERADIKSRW